MRMVETPVPAAPLLPKPPTVTWEAVQAAAVEIGSVVLVGCVVVDVLVDDVVGTAELVQPASTSDMATITTAPSLHMMVMAHIEGRAGRWRPRTRRWYPPWRM
jgi:hypothetical protein